MSTPPLTRQNLLFLATGLAGSFLVNLSAQFTSANISDIQQGLLAGADEGSWITTAYTMGSCVGIVTSGLLIGALSIGRYLVVSSILFAAAALAGASTSELGAMVALRSLQGFAAGGFGPAAFVAVFMVAGGPRLAHAVIILAFALLFSGTAGAAIAGYVSDSFGWRGLFAVQAAIGAALALAACLWVPHKALNWSALRADWRSIILLSLALASLMLVLNQGARRFWFANEIIVWGTALTAAAWASFIFVSRSSPVPIVAPRLLLTQKFGLPIGLNFLLRAGLAVSSYLVPQFLATVEGYRPLDVSELMLWAAAAQLLALPLVWWFLHLCDLRVAMAIGVVLLLSGIILMGSEATTSAREYFHYGLAIYAAGQLLLLTPAMIVGTGSLKPADLPTASLTFNISNLAGTTLGVGILSSFVAERQKFHSDALTEAASLYRASDGEWVSGLVGAVAGRVASDAGATVRAAAQIGSAARRQAWALAFGDGFLVVALMLVLGIVAVVAIGRSPPIPRPVKFFRREKPLETENHVA
ncbi:drug resistance transporter, EmrB/QacA subfamily (plasmid) [Sinorhizobium fredii NGR234]|uniref:Drug resistance transporter, EmrB/QacA subfamily n=1 Tax=Sinorhizobium fredii (strain NBRC 101917 / NGR234) TaxID=394 RepID=C3KNP9_SINFN|nr:MFS transporter [Sinorhizobium fredii]ACP21707.1 drug resistance transporter, EmrB/QacA subfamily [Sinorhizobium fredii NGR234]